MRLTMALKPGSGARRVAPPKPVAIEAMVIDERREPVELLPGVKPLNAVAEGLSLASELPLLPGSHVLVQVGDRHALDAASKRFELEVLRCRKWVRGHEVQARLVSGQLPSEWKRAA